MIIAPTLLNGLIIAAFYIIIQFFMRLGAGYWSDKPIGKAFAFIS